MKMKYLSLALAAVLATTLTACGDDDDSNHMGTETPAEQTPEEKAAAEKAAAEKAAAEKAAKEAAEKAAQLEKDKVTDTDGDGKMDAVDDDIDGDGVLNDDDSDPRDKTKGKKDTGAKDDNANSDNNVVGISKGGKLSEKPSTGTQHYNRATGSDFDTTNNPQSTSEKGDGLVVNFDKLVNTEMANIVVGRNKTDRNGNRLTFFIGTDVNDRSLPQSLQSINKDNVDPDLLAITDVAKNNGLLHVHGNVFDLNGAVNTKLEESTRVNGKVKGHVFIDGEEDDQQIKSANGDSRIFGANWSTDSDDSLSTSTAYNENSRMFVDMKKMPTPTAADYNNFYVDSTGRERAKLIDLEEVQYGRVTAQLDTLDEYNADEHTTHILGGRSYHQINPNDAGDVTEFLSVTNNSANNVDVDTYFYRGNQRTGEGKVDALQSSGSAHYYGQALMYGLDNGYHGDVAGGGNSNAVGGSSGTFVDAIGNFVEAKADFDKSSVKGNVYNVWRAKDGKLTKDNLVKFDGEILGENSISGTAGRTYVSNGKHDADFVGSFYGNKGAEMGGSFSSIMKEDGEVQFGKVGWGGVFGAIKYSSESGPESE